MQMYFSGGAAPKAVTLTSPQQYSVVQRNGSNLGNINISGVVDGAYNQIQVRAVAIQNGTGFDWTTILNGNAGPSFGASITLPGGDYQIDVRALNAGFSSPTTTILKVGVGEIFIMIGQSLFAGYNSTPNTPSDQRVRSLDTTTGKWQFGADPQPPPLDNGIGAGGTPVPALGDNLVAHLNLPIGFLDVARGGSHIQMWLNSVADPTYAWPSPNNYWAYLAGAINALPYQGFRAILWGQGSAEVQGAGFNTGGLKLTTLQYESFMTELVGQIQSLAGWTVPVGINNTETYDGTNLADGTAIINAQNWCATPGNILGAFRCGNDDSLGDSYRLPDHQHFTNAGSVAQAALIGSDLITQFGW